MITEQGLAFPYRRSRATGYALASDDELIDAEIVLVLGTPLGSVKYNYEFGSRIDELRHKDDPDEIMHLSHAHTIDALRRWVPRARVVRFSSKLVPQPSGPNLIEISLSWAPQNQGASLNIKPRPIRVLV